ncbi:MAG: response regulator, partial [Anaerolineae bacterium]
TRDTLTRDTSTRDTHYEVHFAVRDTGLGIPPDRLHRLFRSFSQVDASTTRKYGGTGLGLAISKRLAELMDGTMWVESDGVPGQGSTFHFTIRAEAGASPSPVYRLGSQPELTGKRLLIVDDNATNRRILIRQAESWGMAPRAAACGSEALDWIREGQAFDIAILDMQMPEMDGLMLAREIRRHRGADELPLVMLTSLGWRDPAQEAGALTADFAAYLHKPIKQSHLYNVLLEVLAGQANQYRPQTRSVELDHDLGERHPLRILLAEDNVVNQKVALNLLKRLGYRADVAGNGLEVLEALERQTYDVVLMDVQMPDMDGLEATQQILERWPGDERPRIIAMTANAMDGDRQKCLDVGMDDYISKPVRVEELVEALEKCPAGANGHAPPALPANFEAPVASPPASSAVDLAVLGQVRDMIGDEFSDLIAIFLDDTPYVLATMKEALARNDVDALQRTAHTLKSSSATFGAMALSTLCFELESLCQAGSLDGAANRVAQIEAAYEGVKSALEVEIRNGKH